MKIRNQILILSILITILPSLYSQESLKSIEEEYYDFLSLTGVTERPTLGYRTLSDNVWKFKEIETFEENEDGTFTKVRVPGKESDAHIWKNNNLGTTYTLWKAPNPADNWFARGIKQGITARIYGPEWFNSYNTAAPYGQNDGALWQGRGYNTSLTVGLRLEGYGFELTFKPQVCWMENREFEYIKPNYSGTNYTDKAEKYGYYGVRSIDAPQRFGDESFWTFDLGDTEVRWTWNTFTVGFGTQSIWLGPAKLNPIIHSNNAPSYPKFDIGFRKTKLTMPYFGWDLGDIEARGWWGKLSESDWFDNDDSNDDNLISGIALYYQFPFIQELTIGFNRTMLSKWTNINGYTLFDIFVPYMESDAGIDESDGRASIVFDYKIIKVGLEFYFEWARNDFQAAKGNFLRYPFHTQAWTIGGIKNLIFSDKISANLLFEITDIVCSQDYGRTYKWSSTFYGHHKVLQGYTNKGQWLGAVMGTGGNSQYIGFTLYYPKGKTNIFINRVNPDLDFAWFINTHKETTYASELQTFIIFGLESSYFISENFILEANLKPIYILSKNATLDTESWNLSFCIKAKYNF